jgi:imidazolonepropionase-like amidohydrolase
MSKLWRLNLAIINAVLFLGIWTLSVHSQVRRYVTPPTHIVAIRAGRLFDAKSGNMVNNQIVLIKGERITDVGPNVQVPREATLIDLSNATVLPGMIDTHVHVVTGGETAAQRAIIAVANAQTDLAAGFTTVADMDSRGGFGTVDLRDSINEGLVQGPRMQVVGQSLNQRAGNYYPDNQSLRFLERAVACSCRCPRSEAARRGYGQDLHHAGLCRSGPHVETGCDAGQ